MSRAARASIFGALGVVGVLGASAAGTACSLISGWSDLQTATKDAAPKPGAGDSGNGTSGGGGDSGEGTSGGDGSSGSSGDAGASGDGGTVPPGVTCGLGVCAAGEGCCVSFSGGKTCGQAAACDSSQGEMFFACTNSASCDSRAPLCCFDFGAQTAACAGACGQGNQVVCDSAPSACPQGQSCTGHSTGTPSIRTCQ